GERARGVAMLGLIASVGLAFAAPAAPPSPAAAGHWETGVLCVSRAPGEQHCYPVIVRTGRGNLFTTWTTETGLGAGKEIKIVGAFSRHGGKSWDAPRVLIHTPGMGDFDPNVVADGDRLLVYSTTTPVPQPVIDRSEVWMTSTEDEGAGWTKPVRIPFPFKYLVG